MKTLLLSMLLFTFGFSNDGSLEKAKTFPKYNKSLYFVGTCQCTGAFCSASQNCDGSNCTCSCGFFSCSCTACEQLPKGGNQAFNSNEKVVDLTPVSISEGQYKNIEKLAILLRENNEVNSLKAHNFLIDMIKSLEMQDYALYHKTADLFISQLKSIPTLSKNSINTYIKELGTDFKI